MKFPGEAWKRRVLLSFYVYAIVLIITFILLDIFMQNLVSRHQRWEKEIGISLGLNSIRARLEESVYANLMLIHGMAAHISIDPLITRARFSALAGEMMRQPNMLINLAAAPDFVITYVYPTAGNENVVGVDYRDLPGQWEQALQARKTGRLVVAGPLKLVQGGFGLIGRAPVFIRQKGGDKFWGLVSAVIDMDRLLAKAGLTAPDLEFDIAIRGRDGKGASGEVFWGEADLFHERQESILRKVVLPSGEWLMAARPKTGWHDGSSLSYLIHVSCFIVLFVILYAYRMRVDHERQLIRSEENLRQSEEKFKSIFLHSNVGIAFTHRDGRISDCNKAFQEILGYDLKELGAMPLGDISHEEDLKNEEKYYRLILSNEIDSFRVEKRIRHKNGDFVWVDLSVATIRDDTRQPEYFVAMILNVTQKKMIEQAVTEAELRYRTLVDLSPDGIVILDPITSLPVEFNRTAHEQLGYTREEFFNLRIPDYEALEKSEETRAHVESTLARDGDDFETLHRRKDGALLNVQVILRVLSLEGRKVFISIYRNITDLKKNEQALRSLSDRLSLATRAGGIGVWDWNIIDRHLLWDRQMYSIYDVDHEDGDNLFDKWQSLVHPDDIAKTEELLRKTLDEKMHFDTEFRIVTPSGSTKHVKAAAILVKDDDGNPERLIGVNWDISARKEAEIKLTEARQHLVDILESTTDAFFEVDADFNLTYLNKRAEKKLGVSSTEVLGLHYWELFPSSVGTRFDREFHRAMAAQKVVTFEEFLPDSERWHEIWAYPTPGSLSVYFHDITDRKVLEQEMESIFNLSLDMIGMVGFDGYLIKINPSWSKTLGWSEAELLTNPWSDLIHPDDRAETLKAEKKLIAGRPVYGFENRHLCRDGTYKWLSWNSFPDKKRAIIYTVVRDVTGKKKREKAMVDTQKELESHVVERTEALARANEELRAAKEAAEVGSRAKTEFLANVSHELRTPLNPIIGMTDLLMEMDLNTEQKSFLNDIRSSAYRLLYIVDDLVELSGIESGGRKRPVNQFSVVSILNIVLEEIKSRAEEKKLGVHLKTDPAVPDFVYGDPFSLKKVMQKILENAVKFTREGHVALEADVAGMESEACRIIFRVRDSGVGIPQDKIRLLFEDFSQADSSNTRRYGGLGLGLTLARRFVESMNGELWAESVEGEGSTFFISLPFVLTEPGGPGPDNNFK